MERGRRPGFGGSHAVGAIIGRFPRTRLASGVALVALLLVAACGETVPEQPLPTPAASPPGSVAGDATLGRLPSSVGSAAPAPAMTFGALADRVESAWAGVRAYRVVFTAPALPLPAPVAPLSPAAGGATPVPDQPARPAAATPEPAPSVQAGTGRATPAFAAAATPEPVASPVLGPAAAAPATPVRGREGTVEIVRDVQLPDRQRQRLRGGGSDDHEAIVVGDTLYLRGPLAAKLVPGAAADAWLAMPVSSLVMSAEAMQLLGGLGLPPVSPLAGVPENLRPQELREVGEDDVDGRLCRGWAGANTTPTGTRLDITVWIANDGLPCAIETRVGIDLVSRLVLSAFNEPVVIEAPRDATPVPGPSATGTPAGGD